jgi:hypothetical protein
MSNFSFVAGSITFSINEGGCAGTDRIFIVAAEHNYYNFSATCNFEAIPKRNIEDILAFVRSVDFNIEVMCTKSRITLRFPETFYSDAFDIALIREEITELAILGVEFRKCRVELKGLTKLINERLPEAKKYWFAIDDTKFSTNYDEGVVLYFIKSKIDFLFPNDMTDELRSKIMQAGRVTDILELMKDINHKLKTDWDWAALFQVLGVQICNAPEYWFPIYPAV